MDTKLTFEQYQNALDDNKLLGLFCRKCNTCTTPPQAACRNCGNTDLSIKELSKTGTIRTFTVIRVAADGFAPPFIVAMVQTQSGACVIGNLTGTDPDTANMELIGKTVKIGSQSVKGDLYAYGDMRSLTFTLHKR
jgi:uncharacterized protein